MSYQSITEMASSQSLLARIVACAAAEGQDNPLAWAQTNVWAVCSAPDWDEAWDYAKATETLDHNPDTGARPGVINDQMVLSSVQTVRANQELAGA